MIKRKINFIKLGILLFGVVTFLYNCEKDNYISQQEIQQKKIASRITFNEFNSNIVANSLYNKILPHFKISDSYQQRNIDSTNSSILTNEIVKMELDDYSTYTFKIDTESEENQFYNLVLFVNNSQEVYDSKILEYISSEEWMNNQTEHFTGTVNISNNDIFNVNNLLQSRSSGSCVTGVHTAWECSFGNPHAPGTCNGTSFEFTIILEYGPCSNSNEDNYVNPSSGGGGGGGGSPSGDGDDNEIPTIPFEDDRCPPGSGKIMVNDICVCPEGKIEDENGVCVCPEGYKLDSRGGCVKDGHCFELDKIMFGTSSENPYIQNGSPNDPTGENTHLRIAITNIRDNLNSNWEQGYAFYNRGNFPEYGPYAHHYQAQEQSHVTFPGRIYQFGTIHTHPVNEEAIPMFSHDDLYSLLQIRNQYGSGSPIYTNNNPAGDDLFLAVLVVQQASEVKTYAIKISDTTKLQALEAIQQNRKKWRRYGDNLSELYTDNANGINGSATAYQKTFLQFVKNQDLGLDLYEMEQVNAGTPNVQEKWKKLSLSNDGNTIIEEPCNNN